MYAEPARSYIEAHRGLVRTRASAKVRVSHHAVTEVTSGSERWTAGTTIAAVPWYALPELFDAEPPALADTLTRARNTASSPIVTVNLWFDRPVIDEPFIGLPGRTMQWVFDKRSASGPREASESSSAAARAVTKVFGEQASHLSLVSSGASQIARRNNAELIGLAQTELLEAIPDLRAASLLRATVVREPRATFSLAPDQPSRPVTRTGVKNLFLAGDWIATGLPATIESAVRAGHWAAEAAANS